MFLLCDLDRRQSPFYVLLIDYMKISRESLERYTAVFLSGSLFCLSCVLCTFHFYFPVMGCVKCDFGSNAGAPGGKKGVILLLPKKVVPSHLVLLSTAVICI